MVCPRHLSSSRDLLLINCNTRREMVTRKLPWAGMNPPEIAMAVIRNTRLKAIYLLSCPNCMLSSIANGPNPQIPKDCDPVFRELIKDCWKQNASHRQDH